MRDTVTCTNCMKETPARFDNCQHCGTMFPDYLLKSIRGQKDVATSDMVTCPTCNTKTSSRYNLCMHCGTEFPDDLLEAIHAQQEEGQAGAPATPVVDPSPTATVEAVTEEVPAVAERAAPRPEPPETEAAPERREPVPAVVSRPRRGDTTMKLLVRRDQKSAIVTRKVTFTLDVRVELSPEMQALVKKYKMGKEILFYKEKVDLSDYWLLGPFRQLIKAIAARIWNIKITSNDLVKGKHIECKDIIEMLDAEDQIKEACAVFKNILESAAHFGGEEVIEV